MSKLRSANAETTSVWQGSDAMTFIYDGWNCIEQTSATDTFHADFLWGTDLSGSHQRAGGVGGLLLRVDIVTHNAEDPVSRRSYPTYDGNGNVSEHARRPVEWVDCPVGNPAGGERRAELRDHYLDSAGAVAAHFEPERSEDRLERSDKPCGWQSHQYDAFGRMTKTTSAGAGGGLPAEMDLTQLDEVHRFSTKPFGIQTGLYYYGYRYYDPVTGRWPSRDPIQEEGGENLYGILGNNSVGLVDYLGLERLPTIKSGLRTESVYAEWERKFIGEEVWERHTVTWSSDPNGKGCCTYKMQFKVRDVHELTRFLEVYYTPPEDYGDALQDEVLDKLTDRAVDTAEDAIDRPTGGGYKVARDVFDALDNAADRSNLNRFSPNKDSVLVDRIERPSGKKEYGVYRKLEDQEVFSNVEMTEEDCNSYEVPWAKQKKSK